jgi:hypothetical protein
MEHAMLRTFMIGLLLASGLVLGAFGSIGSADAQDGGFCSRFDSGSDGFGPCTDAPNVAVTTVTDSGGITPTDPYLKVTDLSGQSRVCSSDPKYLGNWLQKMNGCGQFCFDFKVFNSGYPPSAITPSFTIRSGSGWATFVANFQVPIGDTSWHRQICAPIADGTSPPTSPNGHWVLGGGATWNQIITNVTMVQLPIDFTSQPSEVVGYDNICMTPGGCGVTPPPEIDGCLKDSKVTVKCNGDGTYTVTLSGGSFTGTTITMTSQTAGVTVTPPQQNWAPTTTWTISGATPGQTVVLTANATKVGGGDKPGTDQCCSGEIKIVMPDCPKPPGGEVVVEKKVRNNTKASNSVINSLVFPIGLSCTAPSNLNISFGLSNAGSHTENNVPYTSVCTVTEATSTLPPPPKDVCGEGAQAVWSTPVITPSSATVNAPVTAFTVVNELNCEKAGIFVVMKKVENHAPKPIPSTMTYPVSVSCSAPSTLSTSFTLTDGGTHTESNIPYGSTCTVTEGTLPLPNVCPERFTPTWTTTYVPSNAAGINAPSTNVTIVNRMDCRRTAAQCNPPMVLNADGTCTCPPGMHPTLDGKSCEGPHPPVCPPPTVPGPVLGQCVTPPPPPPPPPVCKPGTVLRNGECVRSIVCHAPLVANSAGTACVCRGNLVRRGGKCVQPIVCRSPARLNRAGTACFCPRGWIKRGNSCVRREPERRQRRDVTPDDVIRHLPGLIGPGRRGGGDGGGSSPRGGGGGERGGPVR